jgi:hypothetical protein
MLICSLWHRSRHGAAIDKKRSGTYIHRIRFQRLKGVKSLRLSCCGGSSDTRCADASILIAVRPRASFFSLCKGLSPMPSTPAVNHFKRIGKECLPELLGIVVKEAGENFTGAKLPVKKSHLAPKG